MSGVHLVCMRVCPRLKARRAQGCVWRGVCWVGPGSVRPSVCVCAACGHARSWGYSQRPPTPLHSPAH